MMGADGISDPSHTAQGLMSAATAAPSRIWQMVQNQKEIARPTRPALLLSAAKSAACWSKPKPPVTTT
jgi:hypothetical protein